MKKQQQDHNDAVNFTYVHMHKNNNWIIVLTQIKVTVWLSQLSHFSMEKQDSLQTKRT